MEKVEFKKKILKELKELNVNFRRCGIELDILNTTLLSIGDTMDKQNMYKRK